MGEVETEFLTVGAGETERAIAILHKKPRRGSDLVFFWLSGYRSDMLGTKAARLDALASEQGHGCLRFDYSGHGQSSGDYRDGTISLWLEEALAVLKAKKPKRVLIVGSSMGGWIALRLAQALRGRRGAPAIAGMVLVAPAPDFTSDLIEPGLSESDRDALATQGFLEERSAYSPEPNIFTRNLIEDGRNNRVLTGIIETGCPVHILQGMEDNDVPYHHALKLVEHLPGDDVVLTLIRDGDHRLSRDQDLERLDVAVSALASL